MTRNLFLLTARSGSQGVRDKNITAFSGTPALALRIIAAQRSGVAGDIVCSTDSDAYAAIAKKYGAEVPFLRPPELSTSTASSVDVILHTLDALERVGRVYDNLYILEPSSPFSRPADIQQAQAILENSPETQAVVSVRTTEPNSIFVGPLGANGELSWMADRLAALKDTRRQDFGVEVTPSGAIYATRVPYFKQHHTVYGSTTRAFITERAYAIEIDEHDDLLLAQFFWNSGAIDQKLWA